MANPFDFFENPYTKDIGAAHSKAMYEGPGAIVNTTPGGLDYHTRANADVSQRISDALKQSGNPIASGVYDIFSPVAAGITSIPYDAKQAYDRMEPGSGLSGFAKSWWGENPGTAILGRTMGAAYPLAERLGFFGQQYDEDKDTIDPSDPRFTPSGIGIISGLNKLFGPKIASYLKNKAITKGVQKIRGPKTKPPTKTPTPSGWHPGVGGNGGGGGQQGRPDRGRSRGAGETGQIAGGHHFNLGGLARLLYYGGLV